MKNFYSLRTRFLWPLVSITLIATGIGSLGIYYFANTQLQQELALRGHIISNSVVFATETSTSRGDLNRFVQAIAAEPDINSVYVLDEKLQHLIAGDTYLWESEGNAKIARIGQQVIQSQIAQGELDEDDDNQYVMATPVLLPLESNARQLRPERGVILVNLSTNATQKAAIRTAIMLTLCLAALGIITSCVVYRLVKFWVLIPSQTIVATIERQKNGELTQTKLAPIDEIGLIGKTLDELFVTLNHREQALAQARDAAEHASLAKSEFLANMSHELRTPLNGVMGMMQLLNKTELSGQQQKFVHTARQSGELLLSVINDVLDFSKIQAGKMQLESIAFQAEELLHNTVDTFSYAAQQKNIRLHYHFDSALPAHLLGDPTRLKQILCNLISNAIKFTHDGSVKVTMELVASHYKPATYTISVEDSGIGMNELQLSRIFTAFDQGDNSITRAYGGTGLGLTIIARLIDLMQGSISVRSQPGQGSIFTVTLPLHEADEEKIDPTQQNNSAENPQFSGEHVLVVDDNKINQMLAQHLLLDLGFRVTLRSNGAMAVAAVQTENFAAVLMDMQMPIMDGLEATRRIRTLPEPKASTPIIAMTANDAEQDKEKCRAAGMNAHIAKPIDVNLLASTLAPFIVEKKFLITTPPQTSDNAHTIDHAESTELPPTLPGIHLKNALKRVKGNWPFLHQLLKQFIDEQQDIVARIQQQLTEENENNLLTTLHTLKGSAANLGAESLSTIASQMESIAKNHRKDLIAEMMPSLEAQWQQLVDSIRALKSSDPIVNSTSSSLTKTETQTLLTALQQAFDSDLVAAERLMNQLATVVADNQRVHIHAIQKAFTAFDIDQAKQLLKQHVASIL